MQAQSNSRVAMYAVLLAMGAGAAGATDYTWIGASGSDWSAGGNWSPNGPPLSTDSASFTGTVSKTVAIAVGNQTVSNITVTGTATWLWDASHVTSHNTLTLGTGNLNYNGSNTLATMSAFNAVLAGSGGVRVNSGVLRLGGRGTQANSFSGGVEVNGGTLLSGADSASQGHTNDLGLAGITIGSSISGTNDATLLLGGGTAATYTNPITIRAGNAGVARLGLWNLSSGTVAGPVTLGKNLTLVNDEELVNASGQLWESYPLKFTRGIVSGAHNVTKEGLGTVEFTATSTNGYAGTTTIRGGTTYITGTNNSNTGNFTVEYGTLLVAANTSFGHADNTLTLGAKGSFGAFGIGGAPDGASVSIPRAITLAGNGGILTARSYYPLLSVNGVISGSGRLIMAQGPQIIWRSYINGNNDYSGGTIVNNAYVDVSPASSNNTVFGSGDVWLLRDAYVYLRGPNNIAAGADVKVAWPATIGVPIEYVPNLTADSDGVLAFGLTSGSTIHTRLGDGSAPLGNGSVWLGAMNGADFTFGGWSLAALVANDATHTYRLGHFTSGGFIALDATNTVTQGALKDLNSTPHNVWITKTVRLYDNNPFTGTLTVDAGGTCAGYLPDATGNPFGTNTGPVVMKGNSALSVINNIATRSVSKGALTFDGGVGPILIDGNTGYTTTFTLASLTRTGRGTLSIDAAQTLGGAHRMTVTGGVRSTNGMVAPYLWNGADAVFLDYNANGFTNAPFTRLTLSGSTATDIVSVAGATVPAGGAAVYALKSSGILQGGTLTNHGGGLILTGASSHSAPLDFGTNEAVMYVTAANTLGGRLTGSGGLTKSGAGTLSLRADNTGFTGGFTLNQGTVDFTGWTNFGGVANTITLNGGTLDASGPAITITNNIVLGALGGTLYEGTYAGNISGSGTLTASLSNYGVTLKGTNTYSGGSVVRLVTVDAASSLSTGGVVTVDSYGHHQGNGKAVLTLNGDGNLTTAHRLILNSFNSLVWFKCASPVVGSIEGNGSIWFGTTAITTTLRVGGNGRSTDYFGLLGEGDYFSGTPRTLRLGTLVKEGAGTLTLWGECWYRGGTIVSNGTLVVNNRMNPVGSVVVRPGATLDGIGTVGIVSNQGGTVKGSLVTSGLSLGATAAMQVALNGTGAGQCDVMTVNGTVALSGNLSITLGFLPAMGQEFTIIANDGTDPVTGGFDSDVVEVMHNGTVVRFNVVVNGGGGNDVVLVRVPTETIILVR